MINPLKGFKTSSCVSLSVALSLTVISGCAVRFPQVEALSELVEAEFAQRGITADAPTDIRWEASYNGEGRLMTPYSEGDLTVFVSKEGDAIAFDGWVVRSLGGFGENTIASVVDTEQYRVFRSGGEVVARKPLCEAWASAPIEGEGREWRQACGSHGSNFITLNDDGLIVGIEQVVNAAGMRVSLRKL